MPDNNIFPNSIVFEKIYHYIWMTSDMFETKLNVNLPQTVIFKNSLPIFWYFTNKQGQIKKKKIERLTIEGIFDQFTKKIPKCGVVAQLLYPSTCENEFNPRTNINPKNQIHGLHYIDSSTEVKIRYLTQEDLSKFLNGELQISSGVLQQFIEPATLHNDTIQVVYSPRLVVMNKRVNTKNLFYQNVDIYERCCTFDGPDYFSSNVQMSGPISKEMTEQVDRIMSHLETISFGLLNVLKIHFYFKIDSNRKIWFLWSGGVKLQNNKQSQSNPQKIIPEPEIQIPDIHQSVSIKKKPIQLQKELYCLKCNHKGRSVDFFEIKFRDIVNEYDNTDTQSITAQNPYNQNKVFGKNQRTEILTQPNMNSFLEFKTNNTNGNNSNNKKMYEEQQQIQAQKQTVYKNKEIPAFFTLLFPKIDSENFQQISENIYFKNQKIMVCRDCYLEFSSLQSKQLTSYKQTLSECSTNTSRSEKRSIRSISNFKIQPMHPEEKRIHKEYQKKLRSLSEDKMRSGEKIQNLFRIAKRGKADDQIRDQQKQQHSSFMESKKKTEEEQNKSISGLSSCDENYTASFFQNDQQSSMNMNTIQKQSQNTVQETLKLINEIYQYKNNETQKKIPIKQKQYHINKYKQYIDPSQLKQQIQSTISLKVNTFMKVKTQPKTDESQENKIYQSEKSPEKTIQIKEKDLSKIIPTNPFKFSEYEKIKKKEQSINQENQYEYKQSDQIKIEPKQNLQNVNILSDTEPQKPKIIRTQRSHSSINFLKSNSSSNSSSTNINQKQQVSMNDQQIQIHPTQKV